MALNYGTYFGIGKETVPGTLVAPTHFFPITEAVVNESLLDIIKVPDTAAVGNLAMVPGIGGADISFTTNVAPVIAPFLFGPLWGAPVTTGAGPYVHTFSPKLTQSSYSNETYDGNGVQKANGVKWTGVSLKSSVGGLLVATVKGMGWSKTVPGGAPATVTKESTFFYASSADITYDAVSIKGVTEDIDISFDLGKEGLKGHGSNSLSGVSMDGSFSGTVSITKRGSSSTDFGYFQAATPKALVITFTSGTATMVITLPQAILMADPYKRAANTLGEVRNTYQFEPGGSGTNFATVVITNSYAGTAY